MSLNQVNYESKVSNHIIVIFKDIIRISSYEQYHTKQKVCNQQKI